jgi:hypothetical protein
MNELRAINESDDHFEESVLSEDFAEDEGMTAAAAHLRQRKSCTRILNKKNTFETTAADMKSAAELVGLRRGFEKLEGKLLGVKVGQDHLLLGTEHADIKLNVSVKLMSQARGMPTSGIAFTINHGALPRIVKAGRNDLMQCTPKPSKGELRVLWVNKPRGKPADVRFTIAHDDVGALAYLGEQACDLASRDYALALAYIRPVMPAPKPGLPAEIIEFSDGIARGGTGSAYSEVTSKRFDVPLRVDNTRMKPVYHLLHSMSEARFSQVADRYLVSDGVITFSAPRPPFGNSPLNLGSQPWQDSVTVDREELLTQFWCMAAGTKRDCLVQIERTPDGLVFNTRYEAGAGEATVLVKALGFAEPYRPGTWNGCFSFALFFRILKDTPLKSDRVVLSTMNLNGRIMLLLEQEMDGICARTAFALQPNRYLARPQLAHEPIPAGKIISALEP